MDGSIQGRYFNKIIGELLVPNTKPDSANAATLVAAKKKLEDAFSVDGGDFVVSYPTGEEELRLRSADFIGGLRVVEGPSYTENPPGELVRRRSFRVVLSAEQIVNDPGTGVIGGGAVVVSQNQTLRYEGTGGRRFIILETMEGDPIVQQVNARTKCLCVQSGSLVQRYFPPTPPPPRYPNNEKEELRVVVPGNPSKDTYSVDWSYTFESPTPFKQ